MSLRPAAGKLGFRFRCCLCLSGSPALERAAIRHDNGDASFIRRPGDGKNVAPAVRLPRGRIVTPLLLSLLLSVSPALGHAVAAMPLIETGSRIPLIQTSTSAIDTFVTSGAPLWNFGDNGSLWVGPNATSGYIDRSLLRFDLSGVPANATILNATLGMYEVQGSGGAVQVRQALASWTEGSGGHSWTVVPVTVHEPAGVNRTQEPVGITVPFAPNAIQNPMRDLRVYGAAGEVPSQVYGYTYTAGQLSSAVVFFDATIGARQTQTYDIVYSTNGTTIPTYRTQTWSAGPLWTYGPTGGGASGATISDVDNDGRLEVIFGGTDGYVYCLDDHGNLKWRTLVSPGQSIPFTPQVADADGTGRPSIFVSTNAPSVVRLNGTGSIVWTYNSPATLFSTPTLVDVNGDGVLDALVGSNNKNLAVINGKTGALLTSFTVPVAAYTATIADIDGSGKPEILVDGDDKAVHAFALNGTQLWASAPAGVSFLEGSVGFGDVGGSGIPEIVTGDNGNNGIEFALYASNGTVAWMTTLPTYREGGQTLADLTGSGTLATLVGVHAGSVYNLRGTDGSAVWNYNAGTVQAGTPAVADLDRSGSPELVFIEGNAVDVLTRNGLLVHNWTIAPPNLNLKSSSQYPMTSPALADLTGNGTLDIVVPTANGLAAFATGGLDHDWRTWGYNVNHTQRFLDGASGSRAPFLQASLGVPQVHPAAGASWDYRDGVTPWAVAGGEFGPSVSNVSGTPGWMSWNLTSSVQDWVSGLTPNNGLFLLEGGEVSGVLHSFVSADSSLSTQRPILSIVYTFSSSGSGQGGPRIVGRIPNVSLPENAGPATLDLSAYALDNSTPATQLRWNVTGFNSSIVAVAGTNVPGGHTVTITPQAGRWGAAKVTYWLTDPQGRFATQSAWINITFVDTPPNFDPPSPLYVHYNETYVFNEGPYVSDPDTPRSLLTLTSDDPVHTSVSGMNVSFFYPGSYLDRWTFVNLTLSDGTYGVVRVVAIKVTADNPPVLRRSLPNVTMLEGQLLRGVFNLSDYFGDPNGDALFYSTGYSHLIIAIRANLTVDIQAPDDWWGEELVTFRATDPTGAIAEDTILVTVLRVDAPPVWGPVPDLRVRFDAPFSFNLDPYVSDPDTPSAELIVTSSDPTHAVVSGHLLTLTYPQAFNGTIERLTLGLSDGTFTVNRTILVAVGTDWPPLLVAKMPDVSFLEGTTDRGAYRLTDYFAEPAGGLLFWSVGNSHIGVVIQANGSVDLTSSFGWWGSESVTFRATDSEGALQEDTVRITVIHVDRAPSFLPVPEVFLNATTTYLPLSRYLADPDNNVSELFLLSTNSSHAAIIGQGLLLSFSADANDYVDVVVSDGNLTNATTIHILVTLPAGSIQQVVPSWLYWLPVPIAAAALGSFLLYRRRQLEWAFLVTNAGMLVCSVSRTGEGALDTDLLTGMLTTIMDFAKHSFSDERERNLEGLELGEKRVNIVRGVRSYLAVVYRGRTPGSLTRRMRALLHEIERSHAEVLGDIIDMSKLADIPVSMERLVTRGGLPFIRFGTDKTQSVPKSAPP